MNFLPKETHSPASENYSRRVEQYRTYARFERPTGWHVVKYANVSKSSRNRLHRLMTENALGNLHTIDHHSNYRYFV